MLEKKIIFPDHYKFSKPEIQAIVEEAKINNYQIIMTEKDYFKINHYNLDKINYFQYRNEEAQQWKIIKGLAISSTYL